MSFLARRSANIVKQSKKVVQIKRGYCIPTNMKCLQINKYGSSINELSYDLTCPTETNLSPDQALIKVHAASINPFDLEMSTGYGRSAINLLRQNSNVPEFPLILGRDCSGVIVKRGRRFRRFQLGESVYCVRWVVGNGTHSEYVIANKNEISLKPKNISHVEAACFPYVACTTWNALISSGAVPTTGKSKRIFIPAGTGGLGSFAVQLCQAYGHDVITSCASDGINLLHKCGIRNILDYSSDTYISDLQNAGPFDVILDTLNEKHIKLFQQMLKTDMSSKYVSLRPSLLPDMDNQGIVMGVVKSGTKYLKSSITQLCAGKGMYHWGFVSPNAIILDKIRPLIEEGKIQPVIDRVFDSEKVIDAYQYVEDGHARGKTVIQMGTSNN